MVVKDRPLVRHELKAVINEGQYVVLKSMIRALMIPDTHMKEKGYFIRSLYFDDPKNSGYLDKVDGLYDRHKVRLRLYDVSSPTVKLEIKGKRGDRVYKQTTVLNRMEAKDIIQGNWSEAIRQAFLEEGLICDQYQPKVMIDYWREAYTYPYEKIRLTFDKDVRSSQSHGLFEETLISAPVLEQNQCILEIKYEDMLPDYLITLLGSVGIHLSGYSKYVQGRHALLH